MELAERTPGARNRYVDFLRAASIAAVVIGHWMVASPFVTGGKLELGNMLDIAPWSRWLSWGFQVMPIFFIVGGYSNGASWEAARRDGVGYGLWTATRLKRLIGPILPLILVWSVMGLIATRLDVDPQTIRIGSQVALIPTWFLAVYVVVVVLAPATHAAWRRFGLGSFVALALGAVIVDALAFAGGLSWLRWANYAFVWLGVHQVGYMWRDGWFAGAARALAWSAGALAVLVFLVTVASYPVAMISVPGEEVSNSRPPTLAMFALGIFHGGLVLALEAPLRRWLRRLRPWAATVLVNGSIMTLYLWHVTVMALLVGLLYQLGGIGMTLQPGSALWWVTRPVWIAFLAAVLMVFIAIFGRFEHTARSDAASALPGWRAVTGSLLVCAGLTALALEGIGSESWPGIRVWTVATVFAGAALALGLPRLRGGAPRGRPVRNDVRR